MTRSLADRRVVLLDAGGTLITLDHARLRAALPATIAPPSDDALERAEGAARLWADVAIRANQRGRELWDGYFSRLLGGAGVEEPAIAPALDALWVANREQGLWRKPIRGALETVAHLAAHGVRLGVVSNAEGQVEADLIEAGFGRYLETVVDSHVVGISKPDPRIFAIALERMQVRATDTVYVGDVPAFDVDGALAAGITPILLDPYQIHAEVTSAVRVASIEQVPALLGL